MLIVTSLSSPLLVPDPPLLDRLHDDVTLLLRLLRCLLRCLRLRARQLRQLLGRLDILPGLDHLLRELGT